MVLQKNELGDLDEAVSLSPSLLHYSLEDIVESFKSNELRNDIYWKLHILSGALLSADVMISVLYMFGITYNHVTLSFCVSVPLYTCCDKIFSDRFVMY